MQRSSWLKVRKTRELSREWGYVGTYYIVDTFRNIVVDTHRATLAEARAPR
jgi:hypothetical protein